MSPPDSFARLVHRLRADDPGAAEAVFARYAAKLVAIAHGRLAPLLAAKEDPEDVIQSVFRSFFTRVRGGEFALASWDNVWAVLTVITLRKCGNRLAHYRAARRDISREAVDADFHPADRDPTPAKVVALTETVERILNGLGSRDRDIMALHLQGHTPEAIAGRVERSVRTVRRILERIRRELEREALGDDS